MTIDTNKSWAKLTICQLVGAGYKVSMMRRGDRYIITTDQKIDTACLHRIPDWYK